MTLIHDHTLRHLPPLRIPIQPQRRIIVILLHDLALLKAAELFVGDRLFYLVVGVVVHYLFVLLKVEFVLGEEVSHWGVWLAELGGLGEEQGGCCVDF